MDGPSVAPPQGARRSSGELPQTLELVLGNQIYVAKDGLPPGLRNRLLRLAAFQNPEFYRAQAMRLSTYDKPRIIACAEDHAHHIGLPRGCLDEVRQVLSDLGVRTAIRDERYRRPARSTWQFHGELRPEQQTAAEAMLAHDTGVLAATTAFGKTVVAAWLIAQRGVNTLVLVHRRQLLDQWIERLSAFLGVPAKSIGRIGGGRSRPTGLLDVAIIQSLVRKGVVDDCVADYGHLIVDECHHLSAQSFERVARQAKARFVTGLSATVARKDGHHPIIFMQCGPVRHRVNARAQAAAPAVRARRPRATDGVSAGRGRRVRQARRVPDALPRAGRGRVSQPAHLRRRHRRPCATADRRWCSPSGIDHLDALERRLAASVPSPGGAAGGHGQEAAADRRRSACGHPSARSRASSWPPASTSERVSTMRDWTRCS